MKTNLFRYPLVPGLVTLALCFVAPPARADDKAKGKDMGDENSMLAKYDANQNGKLDPEEREKMKADKRAEVEKKKAEKQADKEKRDGEKKAEKEKRKAEHDAKKGEKGKKN